MGLRAKFMLKMLNMVINVVLQKFKFEQRADILRLKASNPNEHWYKYLKL